MSVTTLQSKKDAQGVKDTIIKDDTGYYKILVGAFNTYNRAGIYYRIKRPKDLLENNTILNRRVTEGTLRSEEEHPDYTGMNNTEIINRTVFLDNKNVCAHIKAVEFVDTGKCEKGWEGYNITLVYGWVKPRGVHGPVLKEQLDNPDENVAFSVRSLVRQSYIGTTLVRDVIDVCTWDHVGEPGIKIATQWNAVGIEGLQYAAQDDVGTCVDGVCLNSLKELVNGNEGMDCGDGKCLMERLAETSNKPAILNW